MMTSELFVWIYLPDSSEPVVAGRLSLSTTAVGKIGLFVYGQSYLARPGAIPLDPVALPLRPGELRFTDLSGFPGVILDSCPDRWGIRVIDRLAGTQSYPDGYILRNDPGRSGALAFSRAPTEIPVEQQSRSFRLLDLQVAAEAVESGTEIDLELLQALHPGTGGARPKCTLSDGGDEWIAKFQSIEDSSRISIPRLEHATMTLARACGIHAAETRLEQLGGKDICLVRRFDRIWASDVLHRRNFLSARTVFHADTGFASVGTGSYARLSRWLPRYGCSAEDRVELFRRMAFNCLVRNTDDHELNHGLIQIQHGDYCLAPAYDIVPSLVSHRIHRHALLIGDSGAGTVSNVLGISEAFTLTRDNAATLLTDLQIALLNTWREVFYEAGFGDEELRILADVFRPLPVDAT